MKNPTIATLLNIIPGLGYLYLGRRTLFGKLLLVSFALIVIASFDPSLMESSAYTSEQDLRIWDLFGFLSLFIFIATLMYDAYQEALQLNSEKK